MLEELVHQTSPFFVMIIGFIIGLTHAFEPDHITAVATQLADKRRGAFKSSMLGAFWGAGHTSMILLVSVLVFIFAINIPEELFSHFEIIVGGMLIFLGILVYLKTHTHPHTHDGMTYHTHRHDHDEQHHHYHRSYIIGSIHGLAGSGSLVILAVSTLTNLEMIMSFVIIFGIGSILGMMLASGLISLPITLLYNRFHKPLRFAVSAFSMIIGAFIIASGVIG